MVTSTGCFLRFDGGVGRLPLVGGVKLYRFASPSLVMDTANTAFGGVGSGAQSEGGVWEM